MRLELRLGLFPLLLAGWHLPAADFLPLAPGNAWTYQEKTTGEAFTVRVGAMAYANDRIYFALKGYVDGQPLVRIDERGSLVYLDEETRAEIVLTSFEPFEGGRWEAPFRPCEQLGQTQEKRGVHEGPGGRWDALEIRYISFQCADVGVASEQYVENIGMVRRVNTTFAGPRAFDLVYARVGNQVVTAGDRGLFTVTAAPGPEPGTWLATLRMDLGNGPGLRLRFASAQEYDAALRDPDGRILWVWSADKLFAQGEHERSYAGEWSASLVVPFPIGRPSPSGSYTLEAWLTTADGEPRLGAATPISLDRPDE